MVSHATRGTYWGPTPGFVAAVAKATDHVNGSRSATVQRSDDSDSWMVTLAACSTYTEIVSLFLEALVTPFAMSTREMTRPTRWFVTHGVRWSTGSNVGGTFAILE